MTGHFLGWWWLGSDPFQTILSVQHCEYIFADPCWTPHNNVNAMLFWVINGKWHHVLLAPPKSNFPPVAFATLDTKSDFWGLWSSNYEQCLTLLLQSTTVSAIILSYFFLFNHFPLLKVNFAAVFAELLPHSELAAAERCGVNLAQDLIDRYIVAG